MTRSRPKTVSALFLLLFALAIAACNSGAATPTPTNTPTATPGPTATPTAVPVSLEEVLSEARSALTGVESLGFSFVLSSPIRKLQGSGAWAAGGYRLAVESEACPPAMGSVPNPDDCAYVPTYEAVGVGNELFSHNGSGDWQTAPRQDNGWALGPWSQTFDTEQFSLHLGGSPADAAAWVLGRIAPADRVDELTEDSLDGTAVYRLVSEIEGTAYEMFIEQESHRLVRAVLTMHPENPTVWTWEFSDYDEPVTIEAPEVETRE